MKPIFFIAAMVLASMGLAQAQSTSTIVVQSLWARATPPGAKTGAVYLVLKNNGDADDELIGVETPIAAIAGLHAEIMDGGVMKMRPLKFVDIKSHGLATLKPGGMHIMLTGLKQPLKRGVHFPMTLKFAHAAPVTAQVAVAKVGASVPEMEGMNH